MGGSRRGENQSQATVSRPSSSRRISWVVFTNRLLRAKAILAAQRPNDCTGVAVTSNPSRTDLIIH